MMTDDIKGYDLLGALSSPRAYRELQRMLAPRHSWRERMQKLMRTGAKTPKPEVMFAGPIKAGEARLIRRRGKPPLLVRVKQRRGQRGVRP